MGSTGGVAEVISRGGTDGGHDLGGVANRSGWAIGGAANGFKFGNYHPVLPVRRNNGTDGGLTLPKSRPVGNGPLAPRWGQSYLSQPWGAVR